MRTLGRDPKRWTKLEFDDVDYIVVYDEFGKEPVKYILRDGMELTINRDEKGVLQSVSNGHVALTMVYDDQGHFLGTKIVEE